MSKRTLLYRFFDAADGLLYVGITDNLGKRWDAHMRGKSWWSEVARSSIEWFDTRDQAIVAEALAIHTEKPRHNIQHNRPERPAAPKLPPRRSPAPKPTHEPMLAPGTVLGIALKSSRAGLPLVGVIEEADHKRAWLRHFDWLTGDFTGDLIQVEYKRIGCLRRANEMSQEKKIREGYHPDETIYDMQPLANFQREYDTRPKPKGSPTSLSPPNRERRLHHATILDEDSP